MAAPKFSKADLKQLGGAAFCGIPLGNAGSTESMLGIPAFGEALSLTLALGAFLGAGVWMFRRWGKPAETPVSPETSPETAADPQRERELVKA